MRISKLAAETSMPSVSVKASFLRMLSQCRAPSAIGAKFSSKKRVVKLFSEAS